MLLFLFHCDGVSGFTFGWKEFHVRCGTEESGTKYLSLPILGNDQQGVFFMNRFVSLLLASTLSITAATGCSQAAFTQRNQSPPAQSVPTEKPIPPQTDASPSETPIDPPIVDQRVSLLAVGDIMVHDEQLEAAWDSKQKHYQFLPFFAKVQPVLKQTDWLVGNLETTLSGSDLRFSGYPQFNTPDALATTLKQVGFTALTTANNHSLDRREIGVIRTLDALKKAGIPSTGTFRSADERNQPLFLQKNGLKLAILAYSYGTNGIPVPKGKPYLINLIQPELIKKDIATAKQQGADLVAVALHFGIEYQRMPSEFQRKIANQALQDGADLIIGAHPHVVQPYEWQTIRSANGQIRKGLVLYSLGNFISAQRREYKDVGMIAKLTLLKKASGEASIEQAEMIPTYVHYYRSAGKRNYVIYPIAETLASKQKQKDPALTAQAYQTMANYLKEINVHVNRLNQTKRLAKR